jgi:dihydroorotate dehydrogenase
MYKKILKPIFFLLSPEQAHELAMSLFNAVLIIPGVRSLLSNRMKVRQPVSFLDLQFENRVGLAAGFDKNAKWIDDLSALGFGFVEIGTVTPVPQTGNPKPRLFRLPQSRALINRMGFNNDGVGAVAERMRRRKSAIVVGGNIGKNKDTPNERAVDDYVACVKQLGDIVDYFVINVSSPNTPGLRALQDREPLTRIVEAVINESKALTHPKPVLLKIAPDLSDTQLLEICEIVVETGLSGVIATNTTIERNGLVDSETDMANAIGAGGLSGEPLRKRSTEVIRFLRQNLKSDIVIIGVGGIDSPESAREKLDAGADLLQIYTAFIYEGPGIAKRIAAGLNPPKRKN